MYIGKTERNITLRFQEHCRDAFRKSEEKRPLYSAMRKYGIENFIIELVEETSIPEEREKYWIDYYKTFHYGYNATLGGDGQSYIDKELVIQTYQELKQIKKVSQFLDIDAHTISKILHQANIDIQPGYQQLCKAVGCYSKEDKLIKTFLSMSEAARWLIDNNISNATINSTRNKISEVANGNRKTAYNFIWKFI